MPPGFNTLLISAMAAWGLGQQWMAAPAWMASTLPVAKGRRPTSARTATIGVLRTELRVHSSRHGKKIRHVC